MTWQALDTLPEVIRKQGLWKVMEQVEFATLRWVEWFNNRRLLEPIGNIPSVEKEAAYYHQHASLAKVA